MDCTEGVAAWALRGLHVGWVMGFLCDWYVWHDVALDWDTVGGGCPFLVGDSDPGGLGFGPLPFPKVVTSAMPLK